MDTKQQHRELRAIKGEQKHMDKDDVKYLIEMTNSLAEMNGKLTMLCESLAAHEARISHLEDKQASIPAQAPAAPASDS